jgi:hypothetical protein
MPSIGLYHETMANMSHHGETIAGTGGSTLFTHTALRAWYRNWGVQAIYQLAAIRAQGQLMVPNRERVILGLTYNLTKN